MRPRMRPALRARGARRPLRLRPCRRRLRRHHRAPRGVGPVGVPLRRLREPRGAAVALRLRRPPRGLRHRRHDAAARRRACGQPPRRDGPRAQGPAARRRGSGRVDAVARGELHGTPGRVAVPVALWCRPQERERPGPDAGRPLQQHQHQGRGHQLRSALPHAPHASGGIGRGRRRRRQLWQRRQDLLEPALRALLRAKGAGAARAEAR
mmetsp:Transcript_18585/g.51272  ORF Transcript_18585/g.51272 Transcript_18585/m.51272 type:complete len:209 (-) Transcript_18585:212-838(-)